MSTPNQIHVAVLISSHRRNGNTEQLTELALQHLPIANSIDRIRLFDYRIERFPDVRHAGQGLPSFDDDYEDLLDRVLAADVLLFAAPVYWYSMPGVLKDFLDRFSGSMRQPERSFKQQMSRKVAYAITTVSDEDRRVALPLIESLRLTANYLQMPWGGSAIGYGNRPGEVLEDQEGLTAARGLFANLQGLLRPRRG